MSVLKIIFVFCVFTNSAQGQTSGLANEQNDSLLFIVVDKSPEFIGGNYALLKFIQHNLRYPPVQGCGMGDPNGNVFVKFIIERNGKVSNAKVLKGIEEYYDNEALRVINLMPDWLPGEKEGKVVRTSWILPVKFQIR